MKQTRDLSYSTYYLYIKSLKVKELFIPESHLNFDFDNVLFETDEVDFEKETRWLEDNLEKIYEHTYAIYPMLVENHTELRYALYIAYCYRLGKAIPFTFKEFEDALNSSDITPLKIDLVYGGSAEDTYLALSKGERLVRRDLLFKESIERCLDKNKIVSQQIDLIKAIDNCFRIRYETEVDLLNKLNNHIDYMEPTVGNLLPHIMYHHLDENGLKSVRGWIEEAIPYDKLRLLLEDKYVATYESEEQKEALKEAGEMMKQYSTHYWNIRDSFLKHDLDAVVLPVDEINEIDIIYEEVATMITFKEEKLYRETGEEIYNFDAIVHEMVAEDRELEEHKNKVAPRAKEHFLSTLSKEEQEQYKKYQAVYIKGKDFDYLIHSKTSYNNIIRFEDGENAQSMCVTPENVKISQYDTKATAVLLIKSGMEHILNETANYFPLGLSENNFINHFFEEEIKTKDKNTITKGEINYG